MTPAGDAHKAQLLDILWRCGEAMGDQRRSDSLPDDIRALVARAAAVEALAEKWERDAGPESRAWQVFGPQNVSVPFAVEQIRAALGSPTPTGPEPATACDHGRTEAHDYQAPPPITGADIWHCPGPATPEPTEETDNLDRRRGGYITSDREMVIPAVPDGPGPGGADPKETRQ